eukprot:evm.model.scf_1342EXC.2 EVM.evm.TU.scf_1342EXC.2   scf_1342EXC:21685-25373(-)
MAAVEVFETIGGVAEDRGAMHEIKRTGATPGAVKVSDFPLDATAGQVAEGWQGEGMVVIVTGPYVGIGLETVRALAERGAEVVMAGRSQAKGEAAIARIRKGDPKAKLRFLNLDLSSLASVAAFVDDFRGLGLTGVNVLVNNAGIMEPPFGLSEDGHEMQFASNHLGHFLLTRLLMPELLAGAKSAGAASRVVNISSCLHHVTYEGGLRFGRLDDRDGYDAKRSYGQSKLANVLFTRELEARMREAGSPVTAMCCHPGVIPTQLTRHHNWLYRILLRHVFSHFLPSYRGIPQGAATQVYLCTTKSVKGGEYYMDCSILPTSRYAVNRAMAKKLWEVSEDMCKDYLNA